uniref:Innexin n=1 Tax=Phlebotomus papatasi TaxID=29031 RepID=A0A1B0DCM2_PHLPP
MRSRSSPVNAASPHPQIDGVPAVCGVKGGLANRGKWLLGWYIFRGLKNLIKVSHINIDSPVFRLHYSITVMLLMAFSLIVTTRQYVGNPIDCIHTKDIPEDVLNTYCWIHSTYSLRSYFRKKVGTETAYPGIGNSENKTNDRKDHKYYQWKLPEIHL